MQKRYVLAGDIGGTWIRVAIGRQVRDHVKIIYTARYPTKSVHSLRGPLEHALAFAKANKLGLRSCVIAAAGPTDGQTCRLTNADLTVRLTDLEKLTKLPGHLMNDVSAQALGISFLNSHHLYTVNKGKPHPSATKLLLAAGTGLGASLIIHRGEPHQNVVLPSECGGAEFPFHDDEMVLRSTIEKGHPAKTEDVISGRGLTHLYRYHRSRAQPNRVLSNIDKSLFKPELISAHYETEKVCRNTLDLFASLFARTIRNISLTTLPYGGIYLSGGIVQKNIHLFRTKNFKDELSHAGGFSNLLAQIPVHLITEPDAGLYGAIARGHHT